jgi:type VI secretion system secreted protein VgrG
MAVFTPLGEDALLLIGLVVHEAISDLFNFELQVLAENSKGPIDFDKLLGQAIKVEVELAGSSSPREMKRYFNGICNRVTQAGKDKVFTEYRLNIVPKF